MSTEPSLIPSIDYTSKDFESLINDVIRLIPFFTPEWTDNNQSDFGIVMADLWAYIGDGLHFQIDREAGERFLLSAVKRESVVNLLKLIDFELTSAAPATVTLTFSIPTILGSDLTIPALTEVQTTSSIDPVFFETDADIVITAGNLNNTGAATEGQSGEEIPTVSDGTAFQTRLLTATPIIDGTLKTFIDEGGGEELWALKDTLAFSGSTDQHYTIQRDANDKITLFFGDDANGKIPLAAATIRVTFRTGGGIRGNVGASTITVVNDTILFLGVPTTVNVTNAAAATGGAGRMTIAEAKILGPRSLQALNRAVTLADMQTLAETVASVAKAKATVNSGTGEVDVVISPDGGGAPTSALKTTVKDFLDARKCAGTCLVMKDPIFIDIQITAIVTVLRNFVQADVNTNVTAALDNEFVFTNVNRGFGTDVFLSDITALIDNVSGVDHVDFTLHAFDVNDTILQQQFTGNATIGIISLSTTSVDETWTIKFTSATTFTATGSVSGLQVATGTLGVLYTSDSSEFSFTITAGITPMATGDQFTFRTTEDTGNIEILDTELAQKGTFTLTFTGGA